MRKVIIVGAFMLLAGCSTYEAVKPVAEANAAEPFGTLYLADNVIYTGEINHGKAEGYGSLKGLHSVYTGNVKNAKPNGFGQTINDDGSMYEGEHLNGQFHGRGKLTLSNGSYFLGRMKYDKADKGTMYFTDGSTMEIR